VNSLLSADLILSSTWQTRKETKKSSKRREFFLVFLKDFAIIVFVRLTSTSFLFFFFLVFAGLSLKLRSVEVRQKRPRKLRRPSQVRQRFGCFHFLLFLFV
jgi:hypothetical protein